MSNLKPCPFCKRPAQTSTRQASSDASEGFVAFVVCFCGGYAATAHQMGQGKTVREAVKDATEKWNTRAELESRVPSVVIPKPFEMQPFQTVDKGSTNYKAGFNAALRKVREGLKTEPAVIADDVISVKEVWEAAGGNPGVLASKEDLLLTLRLLTEVCEEAYSKERE